MLRHKADRYLDDLQLWRKRWQEKNPHPERKTLPDGFDEVMYNARQAHEVFCTMVRACLRDKNFNIEEVINRAWCGAFKRPFPKEGGSLGELCAMIRRKLVQRGLDCLESDENADELLSKFTLDKFSYYRNAKTIHINKLEAEMARKEKEEEIERKKKRREEDEDDSRSEKKKKKTKAYVRDEDDDADDEPRKKGKKSRRDEDEDEDETPKKKKKGASTDKSAQSRLRCVELLMEKKYTDEEIVDMIQEELDYPYSVKRVNRIREGINEGKRERQGIPAPKPALEPIVKGKKKSKKTEDDEDETPKKKKKKNRRESDDE